MVNPQLNNTISAQSVANTSVGSFIIGEQSRNVSSSPDGQCMVPSHHVLTLTHACKAEHLYSQSSTKENKI